MKYVYPCNIVVDEEEKAATGRLAYNVTFPDIPGAITCGWSWEEAVEMAEDVLIAALGVCYRKGEEFPLPSSVTKGQVSICLQPVAAAKVALNLAMRKKGITKVSLAEKLGMNEVAVVKLCDPDHGSHMSTVERALKVFGLRLAVEDMPVADRPSSPYSLVHNKGRPAAPDEYQPNT